MSQHRIELIRNRLNSALAPTALEIIDDGHLHAGHAGARQGGHFRVRIVAAQFSGLRTVQRHQLIYQALGELMRTEIHALGIVALTPEEASTAPAHS
jgi:BolA protein